MREPLSNANAKHTIKRILLSGGAIVITDHAQRRMEERNVDEIDIRRVLRGGWCDSIEYEQNAWRYRMCTQELNVIVEVELDDNELIVVTVIRVER